MVESMDKNKINFKIIVYEGDSKKLLREKKKML